MPVTCSFRRKYGYLWLEANNGGEVRCDVWSGGNVMALLTYGKNKSLSLFFSDMKHLRNCCKDPKLKGFIRRGEIAMDLPYAKDIAAALAKYGAPITLFPEGHEFPEGGEEEKGE